VRSLSTGAKAGIGVGVGIAVLLAVGILFVYIHRKARNKHTRPTTPIKREEPEGSDSQKTFIGDHVAPYEVDGHQIKSRSPLEME
jgi:hypothetical protein